MRLKFLLITILLHSLLFGDTLRIAVAANVSYAIDELKKAFNTLHPNTKIEVTLGSSGKLTAQIQHNAPYDMFMAANMLYPNTLYQKGFATTKPRIYAQGSLALITTKKHALDNGIKSIMGDSIKRIAIANPKTAPYGKASIEALQNAKIYESIKKKLIYGESISQTLTYAMKGANFGFIATSSLYAPQLAHFTKGKEWIEVDSTLYTPIDQGVVILKKGSDKASAQAFYDFLFSQEAKTIFKKFGYQIP